MEQLFSDPLSLVMFGLIAVLIFFMFRNGKKRQQAIRDMQENMRPGAEVMLQSGIFATVVSIDEEANRVTVNSGTSTIVVHRNAVGQIVTPVVEESSEADAAAPDDDPQFGERLANNESKSQLENETDDSADGETGKKTA